MNYQLSTIMWVRVELNSTMNYWSSSSWVELNYELLLVSSSWVELNYELFFASSSWVELNYELYLDEFELSWTQLSTIACFGLKPIQDELNSTMNYYIANSISVQLNYELFVEFKLSWTQLWTIAREFELSWTQLWTICSRVRIELNSTINYSLLWSETN